MRVYTDKNVDLRWLTGKICAVIGFGAQGRAHALNLKDSGITVIIGLYPGSKSRSAAKRNGLEVLQALKESAYFPPTLILTTFDEDKFVIGGLQAGAKGYLLKDVSLDQLTSAIRTLASGGTLLS